MNRRRFLQTTAAASLAFPSIARTQNANSAVRIAAIGCSRSGNGGPGRGSSLAATFARLPGVEVAAVCDVDSRNLAPVAAEVAKASKGREPKTERDLRRLLEDKDIDAIFIATPDHWHTPAAIMAMQAGKHVYVEKPCSHTAQEGEWLVEAARKYKRVVQHGTQRRSWPGIREGIERMRSGEIGRVLAAKSYYFNKRPTIARGKKTPPPEWLDWALWQGPAPEHDYQDNVVHYHWHWFWHWGTGELGNNGVHMIDVCRWGLGVDFPTRVSSAGSKVRYDDDQETPDQNSVVFDFGDPLAGRVITWENRSWSQRTPLDPKYDLVFLCEKGSLAIDGSGYRIHDLAGVETAKGTGTGGDETHARNFIEAIRGNGTLNAEIAEGHKTTLLCHLGNIAWRTTGALEIAPENGRIRNHPAAEKLWSREYRDGWAPKV